ncbi:MAG: class II aldolase and adducin N-terminal domain-containing protein [Gammaproteobacteria bacterium]|nr:class II aldolase and adducin N-terminal domain-containing protein [Gammaproteobacteria bacterium]
MPVSLAESDKNLHIRQLRIDLAAAFRWFARLDWNEANANHLSVAVDDEGSRFLINPRGRHFANVRASELLLLDANDPATMRRPDAPDPTAWCIHSAMHRNLPQARCVMHLHSPKALVLACLEDKTLPPIDNNTARFFRRVAVDDAFNGMGLGDEGERYCRCIGDKNVLLMGNHGVIVVGETVAEAFDRLYYFERACETYANVLSTGCEFAVMSDAVAEKTAQQWENYDGFADSHFNEVKEVLNREQPDYRD